MSTIFLTADTRKEYRVMSASFYRQVNVGTGAIFIYPGVFINLNVDTTADYAQMTINTSRKIIPLYYTLSWILDNDTNNLFMMGTPYFYGYNPNTFNIIQQSRDIVGKTLPYSNQATNPVIGFEWNNIDWNETDFIDMQGGCQLVYDTSPELSLTYTPRILTVPGPVLYNKISSTFLYLELLQ